MRNLLEYPITADEVIDTLYDAQRELCYSKNGEPLIGGTAAVILSRLKKYVEDHPAEIEDLCKVR